jgi:hypothetical protein
LRDLLEAVEAAALAMRSSRVLSNRAVTLLDSITRTAAGGPAAPIGQHAIHAFLARYFYRALLKLVLDAFHALPAAVGLLEHISVSTLVTIVARR